MGARILVVGQGAREHALAYRLERTEDGSKDPHRQVMVLGSNAGIAREFESVPVGPSIGSLVEQVRRIKPDLVVVGPESWLDLGVVDVLVEDGITTFGPSKKAAELESSKIFMKDLCLRASVKSADFKRFDNKSSAISWLSSRQEAKFVIKADGLCAGKGVSIAPHKQQAMNHLNYLFDDGGFNHLGVKKNDFIIEEFLDGQEVSVFGVTNGEDVALFGPLQDYKRLKDGDVGPNTGGMGAVAFLGINQQERDKFLEKVRTEVFLPILRQMSLENRRFKGLLYAGLMLVDGRINVLEFNVRFGDPETQALMMALNADIYPLLSQIAQDESINFADWQKKLSFSDHAVAVVLASENYPAPSSSSYEISFPATLPPQTQIFFASTTHREGLLHAGSGRVLTVVSRSTTLEQARREVYQAVKQIDFAGRQNRSDIGSNLSRLFI